MSDTPAAEIARLKRTYTGWRIERQGNLLIARQRNGERVVRAATAADLENLLVAVKRSRTEN